MSGELQVGDVVGDRFVLDEKLGSGAFGTVWRALDRTTGYTPVALKLLHEHLANEPRIKDRFAREARVLSELEHPAVARAIAWSEAEELQYLAMEYVAGPTLRIELSRRVTSGEFYTLSEVSEIAQTIASALAAAHARGIVHRDLKPQNLVLSKEGVKVLDFGIARIADVKPEDETTIGRTLGSWQYMPPEQVRGERVDERCDLFSLGAIIFEMLTLRRAFARTENGEPMPAVDVPLDSGGINSRYNLLRRIVVEPREKPSRWRPVVTSAVDALVLRALESEREKRFASAEAMYEAIVAAFGNESPARMRRTALMRARAETALPGEPAIDQTALVPGDRTALVSVDPTAVVSADPTKVLPSPPPVRSSQRGLLIGASAVMIAAIAGLGALWIARPVADVPLRVEASIPAAPEQPGVQARASVEAAEPAADPDPPSIAIEKTRRAAPRPKPVSDAPKPISELARMLEAAKKDPENVQRMQELGSKIRAEAAALTDARLRTSIERCATTSAVAGDLDALGACAERLFAAQRR